MGQVQHTMQRVHAGRLQWTAITSGQAQRLEMQHATSPCRRAPDFLSRLPTINANHDPGEGITQKLRSLIEKHDYTKAFEQAITNVSQQGIPELDRIQTLNQFYFLVDAFATWIPELRSWQWKENIYHERTDYLRITQFYYYFNQPELLALQNPVSPESGTFLTPLSLWMREFAVNYGKFLDTPESAQYLDSYRFGPEYAYQDYKGGEDGISGYRSFNDWFSRTFKSIDRQRPVAEPDNPRVIAFPAESTFVGQWPISTIGENPAAEAATITVKHVAWPIATLLKDSAYATDFEGGTMIQSFLNVNDYHRQHAPASGTILEARFIPGHVYMDVSLDPVNIMGEEMEYAMNRNQTDHQLEAHDPTGFQFLQCRGLVVLQTAIGKIAVLPIGMAQVSSVVFVRAGSEEFIRLSREEQKELSYDEQVRLINRRVQAELVGRTVKKGDMISSFLFGGSDLLMLFERQANIKILAEIGRHYPVRSPLGVANTDKLVVGGMAQLTGQPRPIRRSDAEKKES